MSPRLSRSIAAPGSTAATSPTAASTASSTGAGTAEPAEIVGAFFGVLLRSPTASSHRVFGVTSVAWHLRARRENVRFGYQPATQPNGNPPWDRLVPHVRLC